MHHRLVRIQQFELSRGAHERELFLRQENEFERIRITGVFTGHDRHYCSTVHSSAHRQNHGPRRWRFFLDDFIVRSSHVIAEDGNQVLVGENWIAVFVKQRFLLGRRLVREEYLRTDRHILFVGEDNDLHCIASYRPFLDRFVVDSVLGGCRSKEQYGR